MKANRPAMIELTHANTDISTHVHTEWDEMLGKKESILQTQVNTLLQDQTTNPECYRTWEKSSHN